MRLLTSALLLLLVADFSRAAVHRLSTEQLHKSDLWKDQTVHILLFSEQGTYSVVLRDRLGTVWYLRQLGECRRLLGERERTWLHNILFPAS